MQIDPVQPGQVESALEEVGCFDTFSEAISVATSGEVNLDETSQPGDITEETKVLESLIENRIGLSSVESCSSGVGTMLTTQGSTVAPPPPPKTGGITIPPPPRANGNDPPNGI